RLRLDPGGKTALEHDLPRQIGLALFGHDHAERERLDLRWVDVMPLEQSVDRVLRQRQGAQRRERLSRLGERCAGARNDCDAALSHRTALRNSMLIATPKYAGSGQESSGPATGRVQLAF